MIKLSGISLAIALLAIGCSNPTVDGGGGGGGAGTGGTGGTSGGGDTDQPPAGDDDPGGPAECDDGVDNDADGLIDWQLDLGCFGAADRSEGGKSDELDGGWTVFEANADTTIYYVSSSDGDDAYSGLAPVVDGTDGPKATIAAAIALLQDGKPDWLLFKRGDTWIGETLGNWSISGRAADAPVVIATYGDSTTRPRFELDDDTWMITHSGGGASEQRSHVRLLGVHVVMTSKDPDDARFTGQGGSCIQWLRDGGDLLIEDIRCDWAQLNLQSDPTLPITVRRSVFHANYALDSHAQSTFTNMASELTFEENLFHHGGWSDVFRLALWNPEPTLATWTAISDGRFGIELDGVTHDISGVDLTGAADMQVVATRIRDAINGVAGAGVVELLYASAGNAFQLRVPSMPSGAAYGITAYGGGVAGTDLDPLFNTAEQGSPESTVFNRNMYLSHGFGNTTVRGNIDANGASGGVQLRMGGIAEGNLYLRNPHAIIVGHSQNDPDVYVGAVVRDNVVLGSRDIDTQVQGSGILIESNATTDGGGHSLIRGVEVTGNILAHNVYGTGNFKAISLQGSGIHDDVEIHDNIVYDWARPTWPDPQDQRSYCIRINNDAASTAVSIHHNLFQQPNGGFLASSNNDTAGASLNDNTYWSTAPDPPDWWARGWFDLGGSVAMSEWQTTTGETNAVAEQVSFVDPDRTIATYMQSLGGSASYDAFIDEALTQSRFNWRADYTAAAVNAYIRAGFEVQ